MDGLGLHFGGFWRSFWWFQLTIWVPCFLLYNMFWGGFCFKLLLVTYEQKYKVNPCAASRATLQYYVAFVVKHMCLMIELFFGCLFQVSTAQIHPICYRAALFAQGEKIMFCRVILFNIIMLVIFFVSRFDFFVVPVV